MLAVENIIKDYKLVNNNGDLASLANKEANVIKHSKNVLKIFHKYISIQKSALKGITRN